MTRIVEWHDTVNSIIFLENVCHAAGITMAWTRSISRK